MTNTEAVGILAAAFHAVLTQDGDNILLNPFEDFPIPSELIPISAETQAEWNAPPLDPGQIAALTLAHYAADALFPAVE